jgi:excisionase family DNA binding protein
MKRAEEAATRYYSIAEAAAQKGVCYRTAWRAIQQGKLQAIRAGRGVLVPQAAVAAWEPAYERAPHAYRRERTIPAPVPSGGHATAEPAIAEDIRVSAEHRERVKRQLLMHFMDNPFLRDSAAGIARTAGVSQEQVSQALAELAASGQIYTTTWPGDFTVYAYRR